MKSLLLIIGILFMFTQLTFADDGLIHVKSNHSVKVTTDNLEKILKKKGMTVFVRINHTENAKKVDKKLRATEVLIFGNPKYLVNRHKIKECKKIITKVENVLKNFSKAATM